MIGLADAWVAMQVTCSLEEMQHANPSGEIKLEG